MFSIGLLRGINKRALFRILAVLCLQQNSLEAQQTKPYRVGVILQGGPFYAAIGGMRTGLRELGYGEGKHFILEIRDAKGDLKGVEEAARTLARDKVDLLYILASSVTQIVNKVTVGIPIVFCVGSDPVEQGLVQSFVKPGGRLTGVHYLVTDLTAKRLEILKEIVPKLSRVVTFYDPGNRAAREAATLGREAARHLKVQLVERHASSVEDLGRGLQALKTDESDAYFYISDAMVTSQAELVIETARAKKLASMFHERNFVSKGGLASYGPNYHEIGRLSAKYVYRVLNGTQPQDLRIETVDNVELVINLKTAQHISLKIPPEVLQRADKVIK